MDQNAPFPTLQEIEESHIRAAVERCGGNMTQAAKLLGIDRRTLYRRAAEAGIKPSRAVAMRRAWSDPEALKARLAELESK